MSVTSKDIQDACVQARTNGCLDVCGDLTTEKIKTYIIPLLTDNTARLTSLSFRETNPIYDAGAQVIAEGLKQNVTLISIDFFGNHIGDAGAHALAKALERHPTCTSLNFGCNRIGNTGAHALAKLLEVNKSLRSLTLKNNPIKDVGIQALASGLSKNTTLVELDLFNCWIADVGAQALLEALKQNNTLSFFKFNGEIRGDTERELRKLQKAMEQRRILTEIASQRILSLGWKLCLMSELPGNGNPRFASVYLEKQGNTLKYLVSSPSGQTIEGTLNIVIEGALTKALLREEKIKSEILTITSQRDHTPPLANVIMDPKLLHVIADLGGFKSLQKKKEKGQPFTPMMTCTTSTAPLKGEGQVTVHVSCQEEKPIDPPMITILDLIQEIQSGMLLGKKEFLEHFNTIGAMANTASLDTTDVNTIIQQLETIVCDCKDKGKDLKLNRQAVLESVTSCKQIFIDLLKQMRVKALSAY